MEQVSGRNEDRVSSSKHIRNDLPQKIEGLRINCRIKDEYESRDKVLREKN